MCTTALLTDSYETETQRQHRSCNACKWTGVITWCGMVARQTARITDVNSRSRLSCSECKNVNWDTTCKKSAVNVGRKMTSGWSDQRSTQRQHMLEKNKSRWWQQQQNDGYCYSETATRRNYGTCETGNRWPSVGSVGGGLFRAHRILADTCRRWVRCHEPLK